MVVMGVLGLCVIAICAFVGYDIGTSKGMPMLGFVLGLFFNVVGCLIITALPSRYESRAATYDAVLAATARPDAPGLIPCQICGRRMSSMETACPYCAAPVRSLPQFLRAKDRPVRAELAPDAFEQLKIEFGDIFDQLWHEASRLPKWPEDRWSALHSACLEVQQGMEPASAVRRSFVRA